jgi:hypothetical protein
VGRRWAIAFVVVRPTEVVAQMQMQAQEKQRLVGILPNFYTSYVWNAAPLNTNPGGCGSCAVEGPARGLREPVRGMSAACEEDTEMPDCAFLILPPTVPLENSRCWSAWRSG